MDNNELFFDDIDTIKLYDIDKTLNIGTSSVIGQRKEQQDSLKTDSYYSYLENGRAIAVLCDGMGGMNGGAMASELCASTVYNLFHSQEEIPSVQNFYRSAIYEADKAVCSLTGEDGSPVYGAGTTMVSVVVDEDKLYWASVGDSRIYIIRNNQMLCITNDHNYLMLLNERVKKGELTREEADSNPRKEALVSYIGIGGVRYVDMNNKAFSLEDGDYIVMCSDGLYRSLSEDEIRQIVCCCEHDTQAAAEGLTDFALSKNLRNQDNTSVIVIEYQNSG